MPARSTAKRASRSATDQLVERLQSRIARGQWEVNHRLPTTMEMAREFSVSINTVQRALAQLQATGLIECSGRTRRVSARTSRVLVTPARQGTQVAVVQIANPLDSPSAHRQGQRWASTIVDSIRHVLQAQEMQPVLIGMSATQGSIAEQYQKQFQSLRKTIAGAICFPLPGQAELLAMLDRDQVPWITINRPGEGACHNFVTSDFVGAGRQVGLCFGKLGIRRVLIAGPSPSESLSWLETSGGFLQSYLALGLPLHQIDHLACNPDDEEIRFEAIQQYLKKNGPPQGMFLAGDLFALSAIRAIRQRGLSVPQDVAVIGGTGLEISRYCDPPLSTIAQPMERLGYEAVAALGDMARTGMLRIPGRIVPAPLVLRQTTQVPAALRDELRRACQTSDEVQ
jgi:DNA-binding LacI/PurR family transcriptional regulator